MSGQDESFGITTEDWALGLDPEMLAALAFAEQDPAFADERLEQLADDWCRQQHSVDELIAGQRLAGVSPAPVITFAMPANQVPVPTSCRAA